MEQTSLHMYIIAYNEQQNIGSLIRSLSSQTVHARYPIKITVVTDGSTDYTNKIVLKAIKRYPYVTLQQFYSNKGKLFRLNQIFRKNTSDILIILDADIFIINDNFIEQLVSKIASNKHIVLSAAHATPILPKRFKGRLVASCFLTWDYIRLSIPRYDSVHNFSSQATAYRNSFAKKLFIPSSATEERIYIYLMAKRENEQGFYYEKNAQIKFFPITTINDFVLLTKRTFGKKQTVLDNLFGFETETILRVPIKYKLIGILRSFLAYPLLTPIGLFLNFLLPKITLMRKNITSSSWERSDSTKLDFNYEN